MASITPIDGTIKFTSSTEHSEKTKAEGSLSGRKIVRLPAESTYQAQWEEIGITWIDPIDKNPFLAKALLPEGWEARDNPSPYGDHKRITLLDSNHIPRVNIFIKMSIYDPFADVTFLTKAAGEQQLKEEIEAAKLQQKQKEEAEAAQKLILSKRSETWSEESPFGVFFVKDLGELFHHGYVDVAKKSSCQGFFPTEEIANKAKELLEKSATYYDSLFAKKIDSDDLDLIKKKNIKIVNGFADKN
jgi:hypothetical protein